MNSFELQEKITLYTIHLTEGKKLKWRRAWFDILGGYKARLGRYEFHLWESSSGQAKLDFKHLDYKNLFMCSTNADRNTDLWNMVTQRKPLKTKDQLYLELHDLLKNNF